MPTLNNNKVQFVVASEGFEETAQELSQTASPQLLIRCLKQKTQQGEQ